MDKYEALNIYRSQHGDESRWTLYEWESHDRLLARIEAENGNSNEEGNRGPEREPGSEG